MKSYYSKEKSGMNYEVHFVRMTRKKELEDILIAEFNQKTHAHDFSKSLLRYISKSQQIIMIEKASGKKHTYNYKLTI